LIPDKKFRSGMISPFDATIYKTKIKGRRSAPSVSIRMDLIT
jgi:hypothetical protein